MIVVFTGEVIITPKLHGWLHTCNQITHSYGRLWGGGKKKSEGSEITNFLHVPYIETKETMVSGEA